MSDVVGVVTNGEGTATTVKTATAATTMKQLAPRLVSGTVGAHVTMMAGAVTVNTAGIMRTEAATVVKMARIKAEASG